MAGWQLPVAVPAKWMGCTVIFRTGFQLAYVDFDTSFEHGPSTPLYALTAKNQVVPVARPFKIAVGDEVLVREETG